MAQRANGRAFRSAQPAPTIRRLPPSPVLLTSRLVGRRTGPAPGLTSHLDYSALSQALLTVRDRFLSGRRSEAVGHGTMVGRSFRFFGTIIPEGRRAAPLLFCGLGERRRSSWWWRACGTARVLHGCRDPRLHTGLRGPRRHLPRPPGSSAMTRGTLGPWRGRWT